MIKLSFPSDDVLHLLYPSSFSTGAQLPARIDFHSTTLHDIRCCI